MKSLKFIIFSLSILFFAACTNDKDDQTLDATITIKSPAPGQIFEKGDTVHIEAALIAAQELHGWEVVIRKKSDNAEVYSIDKHTHGKELNIQEHWVNKVTADTDLILEVTAALSHNGKDLKTETVNFHFHPN